MDTGKNHSYGTVLKESDIRNLVRLLGDISGLEMDLAQKRQLVLSRLCDLIRGDGWAWSLTEQSGTSTVRLDAMSGGDKGMLHLLSAKTAGRNRAAKPLLRNKAKNRTGEAARTTSIETLKKPQTLSICEISGSTASRIIFGRRVGRPAFSACDEEMARIVTEEITWLHELNPVCTPLQTEIHLSPREREIFALLGEGLSSKAISERLQISSHTVHDYVKAIYRTFGIRSRAEAIKQFELLRPQINAP
jgi:DNA-binding CsgD family transcriptional regulator